jgi:hypothetical protein
MKILLWAERRKLKRSKINWIAVFSAVMVAFIVYMQGQFQYMGQRYVDEVTWYMDATQSLGSFYVFPAIIALIGSYIICRETQEDTLKSLLLIPVHPARLIGAKLILTAILAVVLYVFLFALTLGVEAYLHPSLLTGSMVLRYAKQYLLEGIGLFLAVSPIIALVYRLKKGYWLALLFAQVYSFLGLFAGMAGGLRSVYPITAAFSVAGYYEATPLQWSLSLASLLACGGLSLALLRSMNNEALL